MAKRANGEGVIRKRADKNLWEGQYSTWDEDGKLKRHSIYGKTKADVAKKLTAITNDINTGTFVTPTEMTVSDWFEIWKTDYLNDVKPSTVNQYCYQFRIHINPKLGNVPLQKLTAPMVQRFYNTSMQNKTIQRKDGTEKTVKGLSAKSIKNLHGVMHKAMQQAVLCNYIKINPCEACKLPRIEKKEMKTITGDAVPMFLQAIKGDVYENLYFVDIFTGMRQSEIIGLTWDCIDFDKEIIKVEKQLRKDHAQAGQEYTFTSLKNGKTRVIKPASMVFDVLRREKAKQTENKLKYGTSFDNKYGLVFTNEIGEHYTGVTVYNHLKRILAGIGLDDVRFHDLRHTFATLSLQNGDDIKTVSENLGHATVAFTLDVYGHVTDEMKKASADRMQKYLEKVGG